MLSTHCFLFVTQLGEWDEHLQITVGETDANYLEEFVEAFNKVSLSYGTACMTPIPD